MKFELLLTEDGRTWHPIPPSQLPPALEGEGAFAASNTCIAILSSRSDSNLWFATGGKTARVFHSPDRGQTWQVFDTPMLQGRDSAGIFSIAFRDALHGVIAGGDYKHPNDDGPNLAFTDDGGKTWTLSNIHPQAFFSAVAYARRANAETAGETISSARNKKKTDSSQPLLVVGQDFILDFRPPSKPRRVSANKKLAVKFNAASPYPEGGALIVGPKGVIATLP